MEKQIKYLLEQAEGRYRTVAKLMHPNLRKWIQYRGAKIVENKHYGRLLSLEFQTSSHAVKFECEVRMMMFTDGVEEAHMSLRYEEIYDYFRDIKNKMNDDEA